jgi:uncharacterized protein YbjT (DUF2867 family)
MPAPTQFTKGFAMIVVTGASGQLGRLVIEALLKKFQPVRSLRRYVSQTA